MVVADVDPVEQGGVAQIVGQVTGTTVGGGEAQGEVHDPLPVVEAPV
jgi:hypothetical protein